MDNDYIYTTSEVKGTLTDGLIDVIVDTYYNLINKKEYENCTMQVFTFTKKSNYVLHIEQIFNIGQQQRDLRYSELNLFLDDHKEEFKRIPDEYIIVILQIDDGVLVMTKDDYMHFEEKYPLA